MKFNPKFPTFRKMLATLAFLFLVYGSVILLSGRDPLHHSRYPISIGVVLALVSYFLPKSSEKKKPEAEKYHFTD